MSPSRLPFTCPRCHARSGELATPVLPFLPKLAPAAGARCPSCYARMRVIERAEEGLRALYVARLAKK